MNAEQLLNLATTYREHLDYITNEETAKMSLVVPFIRLLGFDPNNPKEVRLEYSADFTQGDGKKHPDRIDFAIFDKNGSKPILIIETKPLDTDLQAKSQQLARYIAQIPELRFGIITDGCLYNFYGDLNSPNVMDKEPFFSFSLKDEKADWDEVAKFLNKFSRETFNADTLITDAENSRYRQAMIDKLVKVLKSPAEHEEFIKWLVAGIYPNRCTSSVIERMSKIASEAIEPAILRVMGDDFVDNLRKRISAASPKEGEEQKPSENKINNPEEKVFADSVVTEKTKREVVTTQEEMEFFALVKTICVRGGKVEENDIIPNDTVNYFNVSYQRPKRWFLRFFGDGKRKNIVSLLPLDRLKELAKGFEIEEAPPVFGKSRIYIEKISQVHDLKDFILECLNLVKE